MISSEPIFRGDKRPLYKKNGKTKVTKKPHSKDCRAGYLEARS
ncbi:hypothetical protein VCR14J2_410303 [Vibrio coralliirubri]|nr:hypothetical protein VCR15J2_20480 [Vibrio coralliirubri]CDU06865.1 hypothetical protein VCR14J2_410303 [Vibrio coralliirubri]